MAATTPAGVAAMITDRRSGTLPGPLPLQMLPDLSNHRRVPRVLDLGTGPQLARPSVGENQQHAAPRCRREVLDEDDRDGVDGDPSGLGGLWVADAGEGGH